MGSSLDLKVSLRLKTGKNPQFQGSDRSCLLEGIRILKPNFVPTPPLSMNNCYNNALLSDLDSRDTSNLQSAFSKVKSSAQIKLAVEEQMNLESKGFLEIAPISTKNLSGKELEQNKKEILLLCNNWTEILRSEIKKSFTFNT